MVHGNVVVNNKVDCWAAAIPESLVIIRLLAIGRRAARTTFAPVLGRLRDILVVCGRGEDHFVVAQQVDNPERHVKKSTAECEGHKSARLNHPALRVFPGNSKKSD